MSASGMRAGWGRWLLGIVLVGIVVALVAIPLSAIATDDASNDDALNDDASNDDVNTGLPNVSHQGRPKVAVAPAGSFVAPELSQSYRGVIRARRESSLAVRRAGQLSEVLVHEGDRVSKGDVLALLDTSDLDVRSRLADAEVAAASAAATEAVAGPRYQTLKSAAARVRQLQAQWDAAKARLDRQKRLSGRNAGSEQEFDDAKYAAAELKARWEAATAELEELNEGTRAEQVEAAKANRAAAVAARQQIDVDRADSQIVAPYDGVIAERLVDEGEMLSAGKPVLRILETDPLEAHFGVPVDTASGWKVGDRFKVRVGGQTLQCKIARMQPQLDPLTRTRAVQMELLADDLGAVVAPATGIQATVIRVTVGQTATLLVPMTPGDAKGSNGKQFWLPTEALVRGSRGLWSVYVAVGPGDQLGESGSLDSIESSLESLLESSPHAAQIQRREVRIVRASNQASLVEGMIGEGDLVVVDGAHRVGPGVAVEAVLKMNSGASLGGASLGGASLAGASLAGDGPLPSQTNTRQAQ